MMPVRTPFRLVMCLGLGVGVLAMGGVGCATRQSAPPSTHGPGRPAPVLHVVLIRLKNPLDVQDLSRDSLVAAAEIPGVLTCFAGLPLETGRDAVDGGYDLFFTLGFADAAAYEAYLTHPSHVKLLETWRDRIEALRIYDAADVRP